MFADRIARARRRMEELGVDVLLLSVGADLPYFTGYTAMPLERLTMLVLPRDGEATLVVPALEAPRVEERPEAFTTRPWGETEDPVAIVAALARAGAGPTPRAAIGDRTWATFLLGLQEALPQSAFLPASRVTAPLRAVKDDAEIDALRAAARVVDAVALAMRERPFAGRTEADISRELVDRMLEGGHERANFAIVASGPNAASPHHEPGDRVVAAGDSVVCDFGGTMAGYCSDITRTFVVGQPGGELADLYEVLFRAQEEGVRAARVGVSCEAVDAAARTVIGAAGYGDYFIHRTGHGIGLEEHEEPYLVSGNATPLAPGHAFSVEPGIYLPGRCGARIEDIVVATEHGPERLNEAPRELAVVG
ncbi:MAG TPA: Xaa-Pro peptidase family protein [Acidimicrobiia bacterium]|nr:Xaa-Pro peptidase family protein [Acidimicrobiia bacterium]